MVFNNHVLLYQLVLFLLIGGMPTVVALLCLWAEVFFNWKVFKTTATAFNHILSFSMGNHRNVLCKNLLLF